MSAHRLQLRGDLTVRTIAKAHKKLASAIAATSDICIDLSGAKEADLSLIQPLLSAHQSARHAGKAIHLVQPLPDVLMSELVRGGFLHSADSFWTSAG